MIRWHRSPCAIHRDALLAFVDRRERTARTDAALAHLELCATCEVELTEVALAVTALRRIGRQVALVEPGPDAWPALLSRVRRRDAAPWHWPMTLGGLVTSTMLVAVLVVPLALRGPGADDPGADVTIPSWAIPTRSDRRAEADYQRASRQPSFSPPAREVHLISGPRLAPDGLRFVPQQKEVEPTKTSGLAPNAS